MAVMGRKTYFDVAPDASYEPKRYYVKTLDVKTTEKCDRVWELLLKHKRYGLTISELQNRMRYYHGDKVSKEFMVVMENHGFLLYVENIDKVDHYFPFRHPSGKFVDNWDLGKG
jgi:hypothetical protein